MSSSAGLDKDIVRARIQKRFVRPQVTLTQRHEVNEEVTTATEPILSEPKVEAKVGTKKVKVKESSRKSQHNLPRLEARLNGDHQKLVSDIQTKAFRDSHQSNKGINNSELFGGLLEFLRPFLKKLSFKNIDFPRGQLFGEGTEKIKIEVGKSIELSYFEYFLEELSKEEGKAQEIFNSIPLEKRRQILFTMNNLITQSTEEKMVGNG